MKPIIMNEPKRKFGKKKTTYINIDLIEIHNKTTAFLKRVMELLLLIIILYIYIFFFLGEMKLEP